MESPCRCGSARWHGAAAIDRQLVYVSRRRVVYKNPDMGVDGMDIDDRSNPRSRGFYRSDEAVDSASIGWLPRMIRYGTREREALPAKCRSRVVLLPVSCK